jgi:phage baseplate assembly protein V
MQGLFYARSQQNQHIPPASRVRVMLLGMHPNTAALETLRRLDNLIRLGTIAAVDHESARCRVQTGGNLTGWLPWVTQRAGTTRTWCPPTVGEQVILLSPSGEPGAGIALTGLYSDQVAAPSIASSEHVTEYPDGARIAYNHATHALTVTGIATATVQASTHVTVDCPDSTVTGNVLIEGALTVKGLLTYQDGLAGQGGSAGTSIVGDVTQIGGTLSSNGIALATHTHSGVQAGGSSTGGPQ